MKFNRPAYPTVYFSEKIWVKCPKCSEPALVKTELPKYTIPFPTGHKSVCICNNCGFQDSGNENWSGYYQGIVKQYCSSCGSKSKEKFNNRLNNGIGSAVSLLFISEPTKKPYADINIQCLTCYKENKYKILWYRYRNDKASDPYFGFDLLLQTDIKDNVLWLYNTDHLDYLKEYVEAKLREDNGRHKYSMITNLPQWVKSSKNRDVIVKKLNKLKYEFEKKSTQQHI